MSNVIISLIERFFNLPFFVKASNFLNTNLLVTNFIYINIYSFIHLTTGFLIMFLLFKYFKKSNNKFLILFIVLAFWELFELTFILSDSTLFRNDPTIDFIWDMIVGMFGGYLYYFIRKRKKK